MSRPVYLFPLYLVLMFLLAVPQTHAQTDVDRFTLGNQLLRNGEYEEAFRIFEELMEQNPRSYAVYDRAISALINLNRFDEAIDITLNRLDEYAGDVNTRVTLGELYHISGETEKASEAWNEVLDRHSDTPQAYRRIARTMNEHRLYREAIDVYQRAHRQFNDASLFAFEMAENHLAVAEFEPAMDIYLDVLASDERIQSRIQRQLLNYDERRLYDIAILLTEERLEHTTPGDEEDLIYRDFLVWLNMERELYRRALAAAQTLERYSHNERHVLFRTGRELRSRQQFELAEEAFAYYLDLEQHPLQPRSYEELSRTYQDQAAKLIDENMNFGGAADSLYRKAFDTIEQLTARYPRYDRILQIHMIQAELALDHLSDPEAAESYHEKMEQVAASEDEEALVYYVEGRILLFRADFSLARVAFTRSNRLAGSGNVAEKSRYYLGLGDFYNGDFTYSRLQLRSLERQNHSWFANNALQLRYLIQDAYDEEGDNTLLKRYARARYQFDTGNNTEAVRLLVDVLNEPGHGSLHGESVLLLTRALRNINPEIAFGMIDRYARRPSVQRAAGERLLWERARLAELVHTMHQHRSENANGSTRPTGGGTEGSSGGDTEGSSGSDQPTGGLLPSELFQELLDSDGEFFGGSLHHVQLTMANVVDYYEELLMHYPDGYYSDITRNRIRNLEQTSREI